MNIVGNFFLSICIVIVVLVGYCSLQSSIVNSDPQAQAALQQATQEAQPLIDALEAYHAANHCYPRSRLDVAHWNPAWSKFRYETSLLFRVYKSQECRERQKEFESMHVNDAAYLSRYEAFKAECVAGYSEYALRTPPLPTSSSWNQATRIFGKFSPQQNKWSLAWCNDGSHGSGSGDCINETD